MAKLFELDTLAKAQGEAPTIRYCPRCAAQEIEVADQLHGVRDRFSVLVLRFPVECKSCQHRFVVSVFSGDLDLVLRKWQVAGLIGVVVVLCAGAFAGGFWIAAHW